MEMLSGRSAARVPTHRAGMVLNLNRPDGRKVHCATACEGKVVAPATKGNAIALRRIQKVHVIMMCAFFVLHF